MMHIKKTHYQFLPVMSFFVLMCFLSSCDKKPSSNRKTVSPIKRTSIQAQSQYPDIPLVMGSKLITKQESPLSGAGATTFLHYSGPISLVNTIKFYVNEMERSGWDIINLSTQEEGMLVCSKPSKSCVISLRSPQKKSTHIRLFIKHTK